MTASARTPSGRGRRVMIYSQDGLGLGHLRRTTAIADRLASITTDSAILTCMDSPAGPFFKAAAGQDHVKLPSIVKDGPGNWRAGAMPIELDRVLKLRSGMLLAAAHSFHPDLLLVDHMPHGAQGELLPTLRYLRSEQPDTRIVLGLRDILDDPAVVARVWADEGATAALAEFYDHLLIYGVREVFDAGAIYGFDEVMGKRMSYAGFVGHDGDERAPRSRDRDRALVFAMAGGGADGYPMLRAVVDAFPQIDAVRPSKLVVTTGPFLPAQLRDDLRRRATSDNIKIKTSIKDTWRYLRWADAVVAMAGYNSSVEILRSGCPAVLVPRKGPSAEQRMRARLFAEQGWVRTIDPTNLDESAMAAEVVACMTGDRFRRNRPSHEQLNGEENAARNLADQLAGPPLEQRHRANRPSTSLDRRTTHLGPDDEVETLRDAV